MPHSNPFNVESTPSLEVPEPEPEAHPSPSIPPLLMAPGIPTFPFPGLRWFPKALRHLNTITFRNQLVLAGLIGSVVSLTPPTVPTPERFVSVYTSPYPPLAMQGGDPHIRALMRTISVGESNYPNPYMLLYGGQYFSTWQHHPDRCVPIVAGVNTGDCTTAAGRYQFITTTWEEKARLYHPHPDPWLFWRQYSFDPNSQDWVVYNWLSDPEAWNIDIPKHLKAGDLDQVLRELSGTWTSLGYGIESNEMTPHLADKYSTFLAEEQAYAAQRGGKISQTVP